MKRLSIITLATALFAIAGTIGSHAQKLSFGYLSYNSILTSTGDYIIAQERIKVLRGQYEKEAEYNESKFFKMYSEYIQGQKTFPEDIMLKRQKELQTAMEQGVSFRKDAEELLKRAEAEMLKPLEQALDSAIAVVARDRKLSFVVNTDAKAYPYMNPEEGTDITDLVLLVLEGKPLPPAEVPAEVPATQTVAPDTTPAATAPQPANSPLQQALAPAANK